MGTTVEIANERRMCELAAFGGLEERAGPRVEIFVRSVPRPWRAPGDLGPSVI